MTDLVEPRDGEGAAGRAESERSDVDAVRRPQESLDSIHALHSRKGGVAGLDRRRRLPSLGGEQSCNVESSVHVRASLAGEAARVRDPPLAYMGHSNPSVANRYRHSSTGSSPRMPHASMPTSLAQSPARSYSCPLARTLARTRRKPAWLLSQAKPPKPGVAVRVLPPLFLELLARRLQLAVPTDADGLRGARCRSARGGRR
jgi:hypothetical protein